MKRTNESVKRGERRREKKKNDEVQLSCIIHRHLFSQNMQLSSLPLQHSSLPLRSFVVPSSLSLSRPPAHLPSLRPACRTLPTRSKALRNVTRTHMQAQRGHRPRDISRVVADLVVALQRRHSVKARSPGTKAQTAGHRLMPMPIPLHDTVILPCHAMPCLSSPLPPGPAVALASVPCCPSSALHVPATSNPVKCPTPSPIHPSTPALHDDPIAIHPPSHPAIQPAPSPLSVAQAQRLGWLTDRADSGGPCHSCDRPSAQLRVGLPSCVVVVLASTDTDSRITAKQAGRRAN